MSLTTWRQRRRDRRVLHVLWACAALGRASGHEITSLTGLTAYAVLRVLESSSKVSSEWGEPGPGGNRPRYYSLTDVGRQYMDWLAHRLSQR